MQRLAGALLVAAAALVGASSAALGATIFSEDFESASGLNDGKWSVIGSASISNNGFSSAHAVQFGATSLSGDLWSVAITVSGSTNYWITVDYKEGLAGGYLGYEEFNSGGNHQGSSWVFGDGLQSSLQLFNVFGASYHRYTQKITTQSPSRTLKLKLLDYVGNPTALGHVFFDNILVTDSPPATTATVVRWKELVN